MLFRQAFLLVLAASLTSANLLGDNTPIDDYVEDGDLMLAVMLPLYYSSPGKICRDGRRSWAIQAAHSTRYIIHHVNNDSTVLPNTTLGVVFLNDCARPSTAAGRAAQLIPVSECPRTERNDKAGRPSYDVIGVVGFSASSKATQASSVLSAYQIPHVSWLATSDDLSLKVNYEYFSRTVPPDSFQTKAMVELVAYFNWTYISILAVEGSYGVKAMNSILKLSDERGICVAYTKIMEEELTSDGYENVVRDLRNVSKARVVLMIIDTRQIRELFLTIERMQAVGEFIFVGSDSFGNIAYQGIEHLFVGTFSTNPPSAEVPEFRRFYEAMPPLHTENDNIWFGQYLPEDLNCEWDATGSDTDCEMYMKTPVSSLPGFYWSPFPPGLMDSVQVFVHALDLLIQRECPSALGNREQLRSCVQGPLLLSYIRDITFTGYVQPIQFDENGDLLGGYNIMHFQHTPDGQDFENIKIGHWNGVSNDIVMEKDLITWYTKNQSSFKNAIPESVCAKPCRVGEFYLQGEVACCWQCYKCRDNEKLQEDRKGCVICDQLTWPDQENFTTCETISSTFMVWTDGIAIGLVALAVIGIISALCITIIFIKFREKKVIKGSNRELMVLILFGIFVAFGTVFAYIATPSSVTCGITFFSFHLSCTFIFAPLLLKTIKIYRIFAAAERCQQKIKFINATSHVIFCLTLLLCQALITIVMFWLQPSTATKTMPVITERFVELHCYLSTYSLLLPLAYNITILLLCAVFGFLTRKLPDNFNESWYIFIAVNTTIFVWIAFLPTHMMAFYAYHKAALLALALILNGIVTIVCLFIPKIFAVYFVNDKDIKISNFADISFSESNQSSASVVEK